MCFSSDKAPFQVFSYQFCSLARSLSRRRERARRRKQSQVCIQRSFMKEGRCQSKEVWFQGIPRDPSVVLPSSGIWPFSILDCDRIHITESFYLYHFKSPVPWHWWCSFLPATCLSFHPPVRGQTSFLLENWIWGHQVGSVSKHVCHQVWRPEFGPCNPRGGRRELTPACSLLPSDRHRGTCAHTNTWNNN